MPAKSRAQFKLMAAVKGNPKLAKGKRIPKAVAAEFAAKTKSVKTLPRRLKNK